MRAAGAGAGRVSPARLARLALAPAAAALAAWAWLALMIGDMAWIPGMESMEAAPTGGAMPAMPGAAMPMAAMPMGGMAMGGMAGAPPAVPPAMYAGLFVMWAVMMAAMMLPAAAPMIAGYARLQARERAAGAGWTPVAAFAGGYVLVWTGFSLAAAGLQGALTGLALVSPMMMKAAAPVSGVILIVAGLWQFTPMKGACLTQCRSPMSFLMTRWRTGLGGAVRMGATHGVYCVGCCWALMGFLFVVGVMNPVWIVAITLYVLAEKLAPRAALWSRGVGAVLIGLGVWTLAQGPVF